ncbi:two-component system response regulator [candidate division WOR-3 bacterium]|uniref:Two-component system response regulator n=1 Tax=candidate division WOR-3 bacterium TaxID=2052148 RepID=A0A660SGP6_UNCW3|nr:MAG: two-component system response regulator [candidate division WOR-3 bacterium]
MSRILIVEDDESQLELMAETLSMEGYEVEKASNCREGLEKFKAGADLTLLDINLPDGLGIDLLRSIKQKNRDAPVIMVTGERDVDTAVRCLKMGAYDYITKPFEIDELVIIVKRALEHAELTELKKAHELKIQEELKRLKRELHDSYLEAINMLIQIIEVRDRYLEGHAQKVAEYSTEIGRQLGLDPDEIEDLRIAAMLHDLGKMGIPEAILNKPGSLTQEEMDRVRHHPVLAANIVSKFLPPQIIGYIRHHHERWDGSGYPDGLKGEAIPLGARIIAVADVYHALTSDRPYRKALSDETAIKMLEDSKGKLFDPQVVDAFLKARAEWPRS